MCLLDLLHDRMEFIIIAILIITCIGIVYLLLLAKDCDIDKDNSMEHGYLSELWSITCVS